MKSYRTIHIEGIDTYIINKSKFIAYAKPINSEEEAIEHISTISKQNADATHNVYAYVFGENSNIQRYSDNGEPSGTAGIPALNVLKQEELRNICIVITRYFGGSKLGTGGLIRAYGKTAKLAINKGIIVEKSPFTSININITYSLLGKIENSLQNTQFKIIDKQFTDQVTLTILSPESDLEFLHTSIDNLTGGSSNFAIINTRLYSTINKKIIE